MTGGAEPELLVLYGSLRRGEPMFADLGLTDALDYVGETSFEGELYDLGDYPGAVAGPGRVQAELYRVRNPAIFDALDRYEEFDPNAPCDSLFVRRRVAVPGGGEAWAYFYNRESGRGPKVTSGDWRKRRSAA